ncbi:MAG: MgtC/SapB family protein [Chloroherpetonaceae bacterium]
MTLTEFTLRLGLALALGALVGLERQWRQKQAGLRTNTLVSLGSAAFILLSLALTDNTGDPSRVAGQIVTGIGFLGAGVILRNGVTVQGLNTAATIWCSAAVGSLAGCGLYAHAAIVAVATSLSHLILRPIGARINRMPFQKEENEVITYLLKTHCKEEVENRIRLLIVDTIRDDEHLKLRSLKSEDNGLPAHCNVEAEILSTGNHDNVLERLAGKITLEKGVASVSWQTHTSHND